MNVGIFGNFQQGKSTLLNCLLKCNIAKTGGRGVCVTSVNTAYSYGNFHHIRNNNIEHIHLPAPILWNMTIWDTPGFNANERDSHVAKLALEEIDLALVITQNKGISQIELSTISELHVRHIPYIVIMNCMVSNGVIINEWNPLSKYNQDIADNNEARILSLGYNPLSLYGEKIHKVNIAWEWYTSGLYHTDDSPGKTYLLELIDRYQKRKKHTIQASDSRLNLLSEYLTSVFFQKKMERYVSRKIHILQFSNNCSKILNKSTLI